MNLKTLERWQPGACCMKPVYSSKSGSFSLDSPPSVNCRTARGNSRREQDHMLHLLAPPILKSSLNLGVMEPLDSRPVSAPFRPDAELRPTLHTLVRLHGTGPRPTSGLEAQRAGLQISLVLLKPFDVTVCGT